MLFAEKIGEKTRAATAAAVTVAAVATGATVVGREVVAHGDQIADYAAEYLGVAAQPDPYADAKRQIVEAMYAPVVQGLAASVTQFVVGAATSR